MTEINKDLSDEALAKSEKMKEKLSAEQYDILFNKGTEPAFSGKYFDHHGNGMYTCAACGTELFSSKDKFDSGSGWPSFDKAVDAGNIKTVIDTNQGMNRVEVTCGKCGGHLGHVFDDGPKATTGKRFCINSACLNFEEQK